jgi:signal transduction histidine kinase
MTRTGHPLVAIGVLVAAWAPAIASVAIAWIAALPEEPLPRTFLSQASPAVSSRFDDIGVTVAIIYGALSAVLIARRPHPVAIILAVHAIGSGLAAFGVQWGLLGEQVPGLPLWGPLGHAGGWGFVLGTFATTVVPLLLLPRPLPRWQRALVVLGLALAVVAFVIAITNQSPALPSNPLAVQNPAYQAALPSAYAAVSAAAVTLSVVVVGILVARWARAVPGRRSRLAWLTVGQLFLTLSYGSLIVPGDLDLPRWVWDFGMVAPVIGQIFYPAAVLVMVLGPRLRGIDTVVARVISGLILAVVAAGGYLVLSTVLGAVVDWPIEAIGIVAAAVVVLALQPGRQWLQERVDRLVYPDGQRPADVMRRLGERLGAIESGRDGLASLVDGLREVFRLGVVEIDSAGGAGPSARSGRGSPSLALRLRSADSEIGVLAVGPRQGERMSRRVHDELEELVGPIATALLLVQAGDALELARDHVVAARQAERRSLRRELHDGIGPALAGIGFGLAAVDNLAGVDSDAARTLATRLGDDLRARLVDVQDLARELRPERVRHDLVAELAGLAEDFSAAGPSIVLEVADAVAVPAEWRDAVYLIAAEAVHNAVRHAEASVIALRVAVGDGEVVLTVVDDGVGFGHDARDGAGSSGTGGIGVGLASMRERASEAGARLELRSGPEGSTVRVAFPLVRETYSKPEEVPA